jgi:hypothetical protein
MDAFASGQKQQASCHLQLKGRSLVFVYTYGLAEDYFRGWGLIFLDYYTNT